MAWSWGLERAGFVDARIQQTTANLLNRFITNVVLTPTPIRQPGPHIFLPELAAGASRP
jgi:hypothetical protein